MALLAGSLFGSVAHAGPPEYLQALAQHPTDPDRLVLHYDAAYGGLLVSNDGGKRFDIHPGLAFTASGLYRDRPAMSVLGDGTLLVGSSWDGLFVSDAESCIKPSDLVQPGSVFDVARHPVDASVAYFVGSNSTGGARGLWKRDSAGALTQLGVDDDAAFSARGLAVVSRADSSEQLRFVEVGLKPEGTEPDSTQIPAFRYSDDLGDTWTEQLIPVADGLGGSPRLLAIKGDDPIKLVVALVRVGSPDPLDPVLFSADTGKTFTQYTEQFGKVGQALVAPDGQLYLSDMGTSTLQGGLWMASDIGSPLEKVADYSVHCLGYDKEVEQLYLCKAYELGRFDPASRAYCRMYQLNETADFLCDLSTFPKLSPTDMLTTEERVKQQQLCPAWCGASHYASTPFCGHYNDPKLVCGVSARAYDLMPEPGLRWVEPPGTDEPRCPVLEPAGSAGDAGVIADASTSDPDAAVTTPAKKKGDDGCSIGRQGGSSALWLSALTLLVALCLRHRGHAA